MAHPTSNAQAVLRTALARDVDVDDVAMLHDHDFFEIQEGGEDDPLAFAWLFDDGSALYQPSGELRARLVTDGKIAGPGSWQPDVLVLPAPESSILFRQRCVGGRLA